MHILPGHARLVGGQPGVVRRGQWLRRFVQVAIGLLVASGASLQQPVECPEQRAGQLAGLAAQVLRDIFEALAADQGQDLAQFGFAHPLVDQEQALDPQGFRQVERGRAQFLQPGAQAAFEFRLDGQGVEVVGDQVGNGADAAGDHLPPERIEPFEAFVQAFFRAVVGAAEPLQGGQHRAAEQVGKVGGAVEGAGAAGCEGNAQQRFVAGGDVREGRQAKGGRMQRQAGERPGKVEQGGHHQAHGADVFVLRHPAKMR